MTFYWIQKAGISTAVDDEPVTSVNMVLWTHKVLAKLFGFINFRRNETITAENLPLHTAREAIKRFINSDDAWLALHIKDN